MKYTISTVLPSACFIYIPADKRIGYIHRGHTDYAPTGYKGSPDELIKITGELNKQINISVDVAASMANLFFSGWKE